MDIVQMNGENKFSGKKYQIIYADPPWRYKNNSTGVGGTKKHYNIMNINDIKGLPIHKISDENCHLFLWTTCPLLSQAMEVINSWGFKYVTVCYVWVKMKNDMSDFRKDGIGHYTLNNAEMVLLGRKGKYRRESRKEKPTRRYL